MFHKLEQLAIENKGGTFSAAFYLLGREINMKTNIVTVFISSIMLIAFTGCSTSTTKPKETITSTVKVKAVHSDPFAVNLSKFTMGIKVIVKVQNEKNVPIPKATATIAVDSDNFAELKSKFGDFHLIGDEIRKIPNEIDLKVNDPITERNRLFLFSDVPEKFTEKNHLLKVESVQLPPELEGRQFDVESEYTSLTIGNKPEYESYRVADVTFTITVKDKD